MEKAEKPYMLLTLREVAASLRVNPSTISRLLKSGDLAYIDLGGRKLVEPDDLRAFIDNHKVMKRDGNAHRNGGL